MIKNKYFLAIIIILSSIAMICSLLSFMGIVERAAVINYTVICITSALLLLAISFYKINKVLSIAMFLIVIASVGIHIL